ncbi:MAG: response regulator [Bacteroidetes bacterium]|nr:response regulator [Bacteroidota bacterium]
MQSGHILVVEDNVVNQRVIQHMLTKIGYHVELASDGLEAVSRCSSKAFVCVLMDMMMPHMDGITATKTIRQNESSLQRRTPIIAVTANADSTQERRCFEAGMDAFISKPFSINQLRHVISSTVNPQPIFSDNSHIDFTVLNTFVKTMGEDDLGFIEELFSDFMTQANRVRSEIHFGHQSRQGQVVLQAAHSLKGSASVFGAKKVVAMCQEFEAMAKRAAWSDIEMRLSPFEGALNEIKAALEAYLLNLTSSSLGLLKAPHSNPIEP